MDYEVLTNGKIQLGGKAPEFTCNSTCGEVTVSNAENSWKVIFSYKEDFYSVATAELIFLERCRYLFDELHTKVICLSTGNLLSHQAWVDNIYKMNGIKVNFPIIEDPIGEISRRYGIISKELGNNYVTSNVIIIDPNGIVRGVFEYLPCVQRNVYEIIRVIKELQNCFL